jgi:glycosyltransferase involved in cell wall biosynthesis
MTGSFPKPELGALDETPRVSVITIFLNGDRFIVEAIESVLAQDFQSFELILVDDGSTDGSTAIASRYAERYPDRIRYLDHPGHANRGMSASRNRGLGVARGQYIAFIDADDVWSPNKLREQVAIMDTHPDVGMLCGAVRYWRSWEGGEDTVVKTGHIWNVPVPAPQASHALYPLGTAAAPCPSDIMLRADLVASLGGFEEHFTGPRQMYEDQGFLAKLYLAAPVFFSDRVWLDYRQHDASIVAQVKRDGRQHEVRRYFLTWFEAYLSQQPEVDPAVSKSLRRALLRYRHPLLHRVIKTAISVAGLPRWATAEIGRVLRLG